MPDRRGVSGAFQGLGEGLSQVGTVMINEQLRERQAKRQLLSTLIKDYSDRVAKGELDPEQAEEAMRLQGAKVPKGYFTSVAPSVTDRLSAVLSGIESADTLSKVPSATGVATTMKAKRVPLITPGPIDPASGRNASTLSPELQTALDVRGEKRRSFPAVRVPGIYNPTTGATEEQFVPAIDATQARTFQTAPTPEQAGYNKAAELSTQLTRESELGIPEEQGRQMVRKSNVERPAKAADTFATTTASRRAALPFEKEMSDYTANQPQIQPIHSPDTGQETLATVRRRSGDITPLTMPAGFESGKARDIPATIADNTAGINTAEIEGVKILRQLRAMGLDRVNDPLDPRWQRFLVNTLKVAPEDLRKADMQQRIGFVNANLTRALMGSRPSQYVAQTIIQPHLPKQEMTGQQLDLVLRNVLEQAQERREQFAGTLFGIDAKTKRPLGVDRLSPSTGSYKNYLRELGVSTTLPAQFTIDQNGRLVPVRE